MQILIINKSSKDIGCTVGVAKLYNNEGKLLGRCIDTPNAIACARFHMKEIFMVKDAFGDLVFTPKELIVNSKKPLKFSGYKAK